MREGSEGNSADVLPLSNHSHRIPSEQMAGYKLKICSRSNMSLITQKRGDNDVKLPRLLSLLIWKWLE